MRQHAKDSRAKVLKRVGLTHPGLGSLTCDACKSELVFEASARPVQCHLCGTPVPPAESVSAKDFTLPSRKQRRSAKMARRVAGMVKVRQESRRD